MDGKTLIYLMVRCPPRAGLEPHTSWFRDKIAYWELLYQRGYSIA